MHGLPRPCPFQPPSPSSPFVSAVTTEGLLCLSPPRGGTDLAPGGETLGRVEWGGSSVAGMNQGPFPGDHAAINSTCQLSGGIVTTFPRGCAKRQL